MQQQQAGGAWGSDQWFGTQDGGNQNEDVQWNQGEDVWGQTQAKAQTNLQKAVRVANKDGDGLNHDAIREYQARPRNHGSYSKNSSKNLGRKHKHIPWYNRNTPRGFTRKSAVEFVSSGDEFDMSKLKISETQEALAYSKLKDPSLYGSEDLHYMLVLTVKFPEEDEEDIWKMLNMNCGEIQVVYQYFEQKNS
eukprot:TRINITY_DN11101_c0_g1_i2.p2 TRINITY_DN11101_c0_g1~~TRINITY_DN11101_c0_g1_i2.p2  ORF type:complete len:193 (+),score=39.10 TRINITY_DN11101_c0_g1_i2:155-733(+)